MGLGGLEGDIQSNLSVYFIPKFDYGAEGLEVLATVEGRPDLAAVVRKGKVVAWFPRLGLQLLDRPVDDLSAVIRFIKNLCGFFGVERTGGPLPDEIRGPACLAPMTLVWPDITADFLVLWDAVRSEVRTP